MKLIRREEALVVSDSFLDDWTRKLNPGEAAESIEGTPFLRNFKIEIICDQYDSNDKLRTVEIKYLDINQNARLKRGLILPVQKVRNGLLQEVRSRREYGTGIEFLPTFTCDEQFRGPTPLKPRCSVSRIATNGRHYWVFRDVVYSSVEKLNPDEIKVLLAAEEMKKEAKITRAIAKARRVEEIETGGRKPIPDDVKIFIWQRDKGRCVKCSSNQNLEFDHIIPIALGGSNTARNLQLLCEVCNRAKSDSLI